jgi:23S rRNA pseudouridine1911/1915/1917 synthase
MRKVEFRVTAEHSGLRLDQCLGRSVSGLSRTAARVALDLGAVFVDRKRVKVASRRVAEGQEVVVHLGGAFERAQKRVGEASRDADDAGLPAYRVLFEDEHLVVVDKPAGLHTVPTPESGRGNLQSLLSRRSRPPADIFVVQRLDLQTSGALVFAKTPAATRRLTERMAERAIQRRYDVLAAGNPGTDEFSVRQGLAGKPAVTHFRRVLQAEAFCRLEATLETGRTHQIRRHLPSRGLPVLADPRYAEREPWHPARMALHARHLAFEHPASGAQLSFEVPLPTDLQEWLAGRERASDPGGAEPASITGG